MSRRRAAAALLALCAAAPAAAFVRSTSNTPDADPTKGLCLWWNTRTVSYVMNASGYASMPGCASPDEAASVANASFPAWSASCTDFQFVNGGPSTQTTVGGEGVNLIVFRKGSCSDPAIVGTDPCRNTPGACAPKLNCWEHASTPSDLTIALTTTSFRVSTGEIIDADMELFGWAPNTSATATSPRGWFFTCPATGNPCPGGISGPLPPNAPGCVGIDLGTTVTHEAGHMLGLDHVCVYDVAHGGTFPGVPASTCALDSVMNATADIGLVRRALASDDTTAVCSIYPAGQPVSRTAGCLTGATAPPTGSTGGGGCSTGGGPGGLALLFVAALGLKRLRSRRA